MRFSESEKTLLCAAALTAAALFAFSPCLFNGFIILDDPILLIGNPLVRDLSLRGLVNIFTQPGTELYVPFALLTYAVEYRFFGFELMAYHATNLLLHAANALLVLAFLRRYFRWAPAFAAALVFAVHPLNVEAVAWISQRKDVLFFFFGMLSLALHVRGRRGWALLALAAALLSKPMAVVLPVLFILTDVCLEKKDFRASVSAALPAAVLAAASAAWTLFQFSSGGHIRPVTLAGWWDMPFYGLASYFLKAAVPAGLAVFYPFPSRGDALLAAAPFLAAALAAVLFFLRKSPRLFFGPAFFTLALVPVLQIVPVGHTPVADRYAYLPLVGLAFLFGELFARAASKREGRSLAAALTLAVFVPFLNLTFDRCKVWADSPTLFGDNIARYPQARKAYGCRGNFYYTTGDPKRALADLDRAVELDPRYAFDFHLRGKVLGTLGRVGDALADFDRAIGICPTCAEFYHDRGVTYANAGRPEEAARDFRKTLSLKPGHPDTEKYLENAEATIKLIKD